MWKLLTFSSMSPASSLCIIFHSVASYMSQVQTHPYPAKTTLGSLHFSTDSYKFDMHSNNSPAERRLFIKVYKQTMKQNLIFFHLTTGST